MDVFQSLLLLEIIGLLIALYLVYKRKKHETPACVVGEECKEVLESEYKNLFGVHNDSLGVVFYVFLIVLVIILRYDIGPVDLLLRVLKLAVAGAAIAAIIFTFIQWKVLKKWCFWCIISNINTWIIAYIVFNAI